MSDTEPTEASPDPLDDLLRRTMRALDAQTPAQTFDALPMAVERAIDQAAASGDFGDTLVEEAGGAGAVAEARRGRRSSMSGMRAKKSTTIPPPAPPEVAPDSPRGRAHRRSLLETQVGAPHPWWHSRLVAGGVLVAAVAIAAVLVLTRDEDQPTASTKTIRETARRSIGMPAPPSADGPVISAEQVALRQALAGVLPDARGCVTTRPIEGVELQVAMGDRGAMEAVAAVGAIPEGERACVVSKVKAAAAVTIPSAAGQALSIPLFE